MPFRSVLVFPSCLCDRCLCSLVAVWSVLVFPFRSVLVFPSCLFDRCLCSLVAVLVGAGLPQLPLFMGAHLVRSFLGPENDRTFGARFFTVLNAFPKPTNGHKSHRTIPHAVDGFVRSRRFSLQNPFGEKREIVRQCKSESSVQFVSALFSLRLWLGPP